MSHTDNTVTLHCLSAAVHISPSAGKVVTKGVSLVKCVSAFFLVAAFGRDKNAVRSEK